jgi:hypothetical protein
MACQTFLAVVAFAVRIVYKAAWLKRTHKLFSHGSKLLGTCIVIFYYLYLYLCNTTLAVFNCQHTSPSDGYYYMQAVGTDGGLCYEKGTLQQDLKPWAILGVIFYILGFPAFVTIILVRNGKLMYTDQLLRLMEANKGQVENLAELYRHSKHSSFTAEGCWHLQAA